MSLKKQLEDLQQQKRAELATLHLTYLRTKHDVKGSVRDVKRSLSPDRFIRKHLGAALGVGAVLGMILAPRPSPRVETVQAKSKAQGGGFSKLIGQAMGHVQQLLGKSKGAPRGDVAAWAVAGGTGKPARASGLLGMLLTLLLGKLDLTKLISQITREVMAKMGKPRGHEGNGHSPHVSVADAGTVKPDQYQDFQ